MTKKVIKEALEACAEINSPCNICPYKHVENCYDTLKNDALVLITEQEREIERLRAKNEQLEEDIDMIIKEQKDDRKFDIKQAQIDMLDKLKKKTHNYYPSIDSYCISQHVVLVRDIDELIKEVQNEN